MHLALLDEEAFVGGKVDVGRRAGTGCRDGFHEGELPVHEIPRDMDVNFLPGKSCEPIELAGSSDDSTLGGRACGSGGRGC